MRIILPMRIVLKNPEFACLKIDVRPILRMPTMSFAESYSVLFIK